MLGQFAQGGLPAETESDCGRDRTKCLTGPEYGQPLVINIGRPTQGQCQPGRFLGKIPPPGPVVLQLPGQREAIVPGGHHPAGQGATG